MLLAAYTVFVPAFEGAAATGALIIVTWPFIVATRQFVEHARTDRFEDASAV
ncbi:hypothetical protein D3C80_1866080 [compost metagenome]